jgi:hypothetical protein
MPSTNGVPYGRTGLSALSCLSVYFVALGLWADTQRQRLIFPFFSKLMMIMKLGRGDYVYEDRGPNGTTTNSKLSKAVYRVTDNLGELSKKL